MKTCFICQANVFDGEELYSIDHPIHNKILLCAPCGAAAETMGWIIKCE